MRRILIAAALTVAVVGLMAPAAQAMGKPVPSCSVTVVDNGLGDGTFTVTFQADGLKHNDTARFSNSPTDGRPNYSREVLGSDGTSASFVDPAARAGDHVSSRVFNGKNVIICNAEADVGA